MDSVTGLSVQYRIKPSKEWITITVSKIKTDPKIQPTIDISGLGSGNVVETRYGN